MERREPAVCVLGSPSLGDGSCRTLVDACSAVNAFSSVNNGDIVDGDGILGAHVGACTACDTIVCNYLRHFYTRTSEKIG